MWNSGDLRTVSSEEWSSYPIKVETCVTSSKVVLFKCDESAERCQLQLTESVQDQKSEERGGGILASSNVPRRSEILL